VPAAFPSVVYLLCFATSFLCAVLLIRSYGRSRMRLLMWSAACFIGLALANLLLFIDLIVFPSVDLALVRYVVTSVGLAALLYGFIWEGE
jgi:hypothetical protein